MGFRPGLFCVRPLPVAARPRAGSRRSRRSGSGRGAGHLHGNRLATGSNAGGWMLCCCPRARFCFPRSDCLSCRTIRVKRSGTGTWISRADPAGWNSGPPGSEFDGAAQILDEQYARHSGPADLLRECLARTRGPIMHEESRAHATSRVCRSQHICARGQGQAQGSAWFCRSHEAAGRSL